MPRAHAVPLAALLLALGCDPGAPREAVPLPALGQPPPRARAEPPPPAAGPAERRVTHVARALGHHRFFGVVVHEGAWGPGGGPASPGTATVEALGRTLRGCVDQTDATGERKITCPDVGLVQWDRREGSYRVEERLIALRRGHETWAENACGPLHLLDPAGREGLCGVRLRTLGAGPRLTPDGCAWRFTRDGPRGPREPALTLRLSRTAGPAAPPPRQRGARQTSTARGERWTATVELDRAVCAGADGAALAAELLDLAPVAPEAPVAP